MTPERRRLIGELVDDALGVDSSERGSWLRRACGEDERLRTLVDRRLRDCEPGARAAPPTQAVERRSVPAPTGSWHAAVADFHPEGGSLTEDFRPNHDADSRHPSRRAVIAAGTGTFASTASESLVRARLRELPMIYILFLAMASSWRYVIMGSQDLILFYVDGSVMAGLAGVIAFLSSGRHLSLSRLKAIELAIIGTLAVRVAVVEYRLVLFFSRRDESVMAQITVKNLVLFVVVLILTNGLYVPKSWRRAGLVAGALAILPFATLHALYLAHPAEMSWLGRRWSDGGPRGILIFGFDAMTLVLVAAGSAFGARAISRLRRQAAEARRLGPYYLGPQLGSGGMGEVYLAEHRLLKRPCALKLIRPGHEADPTARERFEREVRLNASLSHPNTVEVYDYGLTEEGVYYYVMEYLPGLNLAELVERHGPLPPGRAVYLLRQVCGALREAHEAGLIHRDIKPTNVVASRRGGVDDVAKLLDFGLVLPTNRAGASHISGENLVLGTPQFMSPEQARGGSDLDSRSDIYSLGAVAYYLLTGRPPFAGEDGVRLMIAHARDPVTPPSQIRSDVPPDLEEVVLRCLAKNPADRYPNVQELEEALASCECDGEWDQRMANHWWRKADRMAGGAMVA